MRIMKNDIGDEINVGKRIIKIIAIIDVIIIE
jgi:hypothetical protein